MARKVGFSEPDREKKSTADSYLDEFRARSRAQSAHEASQKRVVRKRQWVPIIFLMVWLAGWSGGILLAFSAIANGASDGGLWVWILVACLAWVGAVLALIWLLKGDLVEVED